jgi:hypothetical protein
MQLLILCPLVSFLSLRLDDVEVTQLTSDQRYSLKSVFLTSPPSEL